MDCLATARQCVAGPHSDLLTFLQPWTELFWDFSFNVKRTIAQRMSRSNKYFSGVQYCKNKMSWMCSKAFEWTMDSVTRACAYYVKFKASPIRRAARMSKISRGSVWGMKKKAFFATVWGIQPRSGRQLEREIKWFPERLNNLSSLIKMQEVRITYQKVSVRTISCFLNLQGYCSQKACLKGVLKILLQLKNVWPWSSGQRDGVSKRRIVS